MQLDKDDQLLLQKHAYIETIATFEQMVRLFDRAKALAHNIAYTEYVYTKDDQDHFRNRENGGEKPPLTRILDDIRSNQIISVNYPLRLRQLDAYAPLDDDAVSLITTTIIKTHFPILNNSQNYLLHAKLLQSRALPTETLYKILSPHLISPPFRTPLNIFPSDLTCYYSPYAILYPYFHNYGHRSEKVALKTALKRPPAADHFCGTLSYDHIRELVQLQHFSAGYKPDICSNCINKHLLIKNPQYLHDIAYRQLQQHTVHASNPVMSQNTNSQLNPLESENIKILEDLNITLESALPFSNRHCLCSFHSINHGFEQNKWELYRYLRLHQCRFDTKEAQNQTTENSPVLSPSQQQQQQPSIQNPFNRGKALIQLELDRQQLQYKNQESCQPYCLKPYEISLEQQSVEHVTYLSTIREVSTRLIRPIIYAQHYDTARLYGQYGDNWEYLYYNRGMMDRYDHILSTQYDIPNNKNTTFYGDNMLFTHHFNKKPLPFIYPLTYTYNDITNIPKEYPVMYKNHLQKQIINEYILYLKIQSNIMTQNNANGLINFYDHYSTTDQARRQAYWNIAVSDLTRYNYPSKIDSSYATQLAQHLINQQLFNLTCLTKYIKQYNTCKRLFQQTSPKIESAWLSSGQSFASVDNQTILHNYSLLLENLNYDSSILPEITSNLNTIATTSTTLLNGEKSVELLKKFLLPSQSQTVMTTHCSSSYPIQLVHSANSLHLPLLITPNNVLFITSHDIITDCSNWTTTMEMMKTDLNVVIKHSFPFFTTYIIKRIFWMCCQSMALLHRRFYVHRDLKPENFLIQLPAEPLQNRLEIHHLKILAKNDQKRKGQDVKSEQTENQKSLHQQDEHVVNFALDPLTLPSVVRGPYMENRNSRISDFQTIFDADHDQYLTHQRKQSLLIKELEKEKLTNLQNSNTNRSSNSNYTALPPQQYHGSVLDPLPPPNQRQPLSNYELSTMICHLADFGGTKEYDDPLGSMSPQAFTVWYRPPELLMFSKHYSYQADIWALGCILGELILGKPLFDAFGYTANNLATQSSESSVQLRFICYILGAPNDEDWPELEALPAYPANLREFTTSTQHRTPFLGLETLLQSRPFCTPDALNLIKSLLQWNPRRRPNIEEILQHPFFDEIRM